MARHPRIDACMFWPVGAYSVTRYSGWLFAHSATLFDRFAFRRLARAIDEVLYAR